MKYIEFNGIKGWFIKTARSSAVDMGVWIYLVDGCLIDAGYSRACTQVLKHILPEQPKVLLITHAHEDHMGCLGPIMKKIGVRGLVPPILKDAMQKLQQSRLPFYRRFIWGYPEFPDWSDVSEGESWQDDNNILQYISTPGHSVSHHVILDKKRNIVFMGDLYLGPRLTMAHPWEDPLMIAKSLRKVRDMQPEAAFCAHQGLLKHPQLALTRKIEFIEWLDERTRELADRGMTTKEITLRLLGKEKFISGVTNGLYSRINVIRSIIDGPQPEWPIKTSN